MTGLAGFLAARIAEDEAAASEPDAHEPSCSFFGYDLEPQPGWCNCDRPKRVLREAEAKRAIVAWAEAKPHYYVDGDPWFSCGLAVDPSDPGAEPGSGCADDDRRGKCDCSRDAWIDGVHKMLAAVYRGHADFDPAWEA